MLFLLLLVLLSGCASTTVPTKALAPVDRFEADIDAMIGKLLAGRQHTPAELAPMAVMPGFYKTGSPYTRLEEYVADRLTFRLRRQNDIHTLTRQNWFEYREGRPLTFAGRTPADQRLLRNLTIYEVAVNEDKAIDRIEIRITATDSDGRTVPGVMAATTFSADPAGPAGRMYAAAPRANPFPEGLEEFPYTSLDRLSFSLAAELVDAYRAGVTAGNIQAADDEVRVVLLMKSIGRTGSNQVAAIRSALQQAIVANRGFTCAVSREDFGPVMRQIDFYNRHKIFDLEESQLTAGTVLLMAEVFDHQDRDKAELSPPRRTQTKLMPLRYKTGIALRAAWRVSPLTTEAGDFIPTSVAGTYLSGFTAKAYLAGNKTRRASVAASAPGIAQAQVRPVLPGINLDVCFFDYTAMYESRFNPVLKQAPGVSTIRRLYDACDTKEGCLCYELEYSGKAEEMAAYIAKKMPASQYVPFKVAPRSENLIEVRFYKDKGFE